MNNKERKTYYEDTTEFRWALKGWSFMPKEAALAKVARAQALVATLQPEHQADAQGRVNEIRKSLELSK